MRPDKIVIAFKISALHIFKVSLRRLFGLQSRSISEHNPNDIAAVVPGH